MRINTEGTTSKKKDYDQWRIILTFVGISAVFFVVLFFMGKKIWDDYKDDLMANQENQLLMMSQVLADNMEFTLDGYMDNVNMLDYTFGLNSLEASRVEFEAYLSSKDGIEKDIMIEDPNGTILWSVKQTAFSQSQLITEVNDLISIWQGVDSGGAHRLIIKKALEDGSRLCLVLDEDEYYRQLISGMQIGTNGYIMIKSSEGIILMHPNDNQWGIHVIEGRKALYPDLDYSSLEEMVSIQCQGGDGISEYYSYWWPSDNYEMVKKISAYAEVRLENDFWVVSSVVDYDDFRDPIDDSFRNITLLFGGALAALTFLFIALLSLLIANRRSHLEINTLKSVNERLEAIHKGEEMIAHQQRLQVMGTMTGGIAHEFNNFLTPIMGYSELLMLELPEDSDAYDNAKEIYSASEKAKDVIRQVSSLSRRNVETVYLAIPAEKILNRTLRMINSICPGNIKLESRFSVSDEMILGNSTQISQVMLNIFANAVHATGNSDNGIIRFTGDIIKADELDSRLKLKGKELSGDWDRYLEMVIRDNGSGMDEDTLRQIFTPFFTTKKAGEGTGLGLALAEQFVTSHRGYILADSKVGEGSVFSVYLPVSETDEQAAGLDESNTGTLNMLIADDNAKVLDILSRSFDKLGVTVKTCRRRTELLDILAQEPLDVLAIDENLNDGSGTDFCMSIQGRYPYMIKIVMADFVTDKIVEAMQRGIIDGFVEKPTSDNAILEAVMKARKANAAR